MHRTRTVAVIIQVVSPLLIVGSASAGPAASIAATKAGMPTRSQLFFVMDDCSVTGMKSVFWSERSAIVLTLAYANSLVDRIDEDFSVADLAGFGCAGDRSDHLLHLVGGDRDLDLQLRQKVHGVFSAAINFRVPLLSSVAFDLGNGQSVNADAGEGVSHLLQLERLDNGHDDLHVAPVPALALGAARPHLGVSDRVRGRGQAIPAPLHRTRSGGVQSPCQVVAEGLTN